MSVERIDFHFDPMCPWAYQASKWVREVRSATGLRVDWRFFSLEEVNRPEGRPHPWERPWAWGFSQMRVGALVRRRHGMAGLDRWYAALGEAFFERAEPTHRREQHEALLDRLGFDPGLVAAAVADPSTVAEVRAEHDAVVARGGFGVPTIVYDDGDAFFGPVVTPGPTGDDAVALWELVVGWKRFPHLYEMRRPKTADDHRFIGAQFEPYLRAREWQTIQNPVA